MLRVGLVLTATGVASAAIDRRSLAGADSDVRLAIGFGMLVGLLLFASFRRPPPWATWLALLCVALVYLAAAAELASSMIGMTSFVLFAAAATLVTAPHLRPLMVGAFALWTPALWLFGPTQALEQLPVPLRLASLFALAFTVIAIADPRRTHPSERLRHAGYGILAISVVAASIGRSLVVSSPGFAPGQILATITAVALPVLSYARMRREWREGLATLLALLTFAFVGLAYIVGTTYGTDVVAVEHRAAEFLIAGQNPYASLDLPQALAHFNMDPELATHTIDGGVIHSLQYPPMSFLPVAPYLLLGLGDIRWLFLVEVMLIAVIAARQLRVVWRAPALATVIGSEIVTRQWILAGIDPAWALYALLAWLVRDRRVVSSAFLGLAIADRQPAWFVAPFFVLAIGQRYGAREAVRTIAIALGVALLVMLPFLVGAPEKMIGGLLAPMFAPLVSTGVGLVRYGFADYGPLFPRIVYTIVSLSAVVGLLVLLWRRPRSLAGAPLVWPFLPLYLAWRSGQNYFAAAPLFAFVADDELADRPLEVAAPAAIARPLELTAPTAPAESRPRT